MKTKLLGMLWTLMGVFVLTSCSDDDDDILASEVPTAVMNAFESKFPNVLTLLSISYKWVKWARWTEICTIRKTVLC